MVTTGPSITDSGRIRALPWAIRKPSIVTDYSQSFVMDFRTIRDIEGEARPGVGAVIPDIDVERATDIVTIGRDGAAGCQRDGLGFVRRHLGAQQFAVLQADHRAVQHALVPVAD